MKCLLRGLLIGLTAFAVGGCDETARHSADLEVETTAASPAANVEDREQATRPVAQSAPQHSSELLAPVTLKADGKPIDIGSLSRIGHAGPCLADVDGDGDRDLLVGDFPGYFWYFENTNGDDRPEYISRGKLQAGGEDAKTPVY